MGIEKRLALVEATASGTSLKSQENDNLVFFPFESRVWQFVYDFPNPI